MAARARTRRSNGTAPTSAAPPVDPLHVAADRAVVTGEPELSIADRQAELQAIRQAFRHYADGADDAARDQLAGIGLTSPFLEWKLLLRGLMAYTQQDDARALDNWRRLDPRRTPARLAAPLRSIIDARWCAALSTAERSALRAAASRLIGEPYQSLRTIADVLARSKDLAGALRTVAGLLPQLRKAHAKFIPAIAQACYGLASRGHPGSAQLLKSHFDPPPDDPTWARLEAIAAERRGDFLAANRYWERYQQVVAELASFRNRARARALIWLRCAENVEQLPPILAVQSPPAEQFYHRAVALDSTLTEAQRGLFDWYRNRDRIAEALAAGRRLLELDPNDGAAASELGNLLRRSGDVESAVEFFERASAAAPLDLSRSRQLGAALTDRARSRAIRGQMAQAVEDLDRADQVGPSDSPLTRLCLRAAIAYRSGDLARGHELADRARMTDPLAAACALVGEAARLHLPKSIRKPLDDDLRSQWLRVPTPQSAIMLAAVLLDCASAPDYRGSKTHQAKARAAVEAVLWQIKDAALGERLCELLDGLAWTKTLGRLAEYLGSQFPREPAFPYYWACSFDWARSARGFSRALHGLHWAMKLAEELPASDARRQAWIERVRVELNGILRLGAPLPKSLLESL